MVEQSFVDWLLEAQTPSLQYLTLRRLLELPEDDSHVASARQAMESGGPIPAILAEQDETGSWSGSIYSPKFTSSHWSMLLLTELSADPEDPRLKRGADFMLQLKWKFIQKFLHEKTHGLTCFWANLLRYSIYCDLESDPRAEKILSLVLNDALTFNWRCEYNYERPCAWGAARALWALAAIPTEERSDEVQTAIQNGLVFLLEEYDLSKANYPTPPSSTTHPIWLRLNFPLFYQADILFVLRLLSELNKLDHPGAQKSLDWLEKRQSPNGRWRGASPFCQRTWKSLGDRQETDRWVSLQSALVLKSAGRLI